MSHRPVVGIATQTLEAVPGKPAACWVVGRRYVRVLTQEGAVPWLIPLLPADHATLRQIYDRLDAVFLTGGVDVDPSSYGEERHVQCDRSDCDRDETEIHLIQWALADHKPILGVCRGMQVINVACGGSLYQHIAEQLPGAIKHDYFSAADSYARDFLAHSIQVDLDSRLGGLLGQRKVQVNSMHHQGVKRLATDLRPCAFAPDGLIEGVESRTGQYLLAVQWHPEELTDTHAPMRRLFTDFIEAAAFYAAGNARRNNHH